MSSSIHFDRPLGAERRRIAVEQIDGAIAELDDSDVSLEAHVHQLRRRCKKLRALARLFRSVDALEYRAFNRALRDVARRVSALRDADAGLETLEKLFELSCVPSSTERLQSLRHKLQAHRKHEADKVMADAQLAAIRTGLERVREDVLQWSEQTIARKALASGIGRTYKKAYKAMREARNDGGSIAWHEWRKEVKYLRYQIRVVRRLWVMPLDCWQRDLQRLSDLIGLDHDLVELQRLLSGQVADISTADELEHLEILCEERSQVLRRDSLDLGEKLFEHDPAAMRHALKLFL